jgi:hypothetical protein
MWLCKQSLWWRTLRSTIVESLTRPACCGALPLWCRWYFVLSSFLFAVVFRVFTMLATRFVSHLKR